MAGYVDIELLQCGNGAGMHVSSGLRASAEDFEKVASGIAQDAFRHVTATGVTGAQNEYFGCGHRVAGT